MYFVLVWVYFPGCHSFHDIAQDLERQPDGSAEHMNAKEVVSLVTITT